MPGKFFYFGWVSSLATIETKKLQISNEWINFKYFYQYFAGKNFHGWIFFKKFGEKTFAKRAKNAKTQNFLPAKASDLKVIVFINQQ